ncbi:MAG: tail fiber domain-containing protein [Acidobacteriota bacterium]
MKNLHAKSLVLALVLLLGATVVPAHADDFASSALGSNRVTWDIAGNYDRAVLTVSRPDGTVFRKEFKAGVVPAFDLTDAAGNVAADGAYTWQIVLSPRLDARQKDALAAARRTNDAAVEARILAANGLNKARIQSGSFAVAGGSTVAPDLQESTRAAAPRAAAPRDPGPITPNDQVIPDDLIVQGSACVGLDCVNNESFGFDTIRLKENNTRIKFEDTSTGTGFPTHDWQLTANDSAGGGAEKFSIEDITAATVPFTITGSAATNSIFVDSTGRLGLRTATPVLDIHVSTTNTPAMRLEQTSAGGFTAQTWDVAGNEANFFVRDVTGGSRLPFRIRPGAPTSSIDINASGSVGIGTASPSAKLHVLSSGAAVDDGKLFIQNSSATVLAREMLEIRNNGATLLILKDSGNASRWSFGSIGGNFVVDDQQDAAVEMSLTGAGNMTIGGTLTQGSSREIKDGFTALDPKAVLAKVTALPLTQWSYKVDGPTIRHIGPMAEDFAAAFGLGADDKHIAPSDQASVALLAVQGLNQLVQEKDQQLADLKAQNDQLASRLANLEKMMQDLAAQQK